jgi:hypothetical protein
MSQATKARSAKARATIAARMLLGQKTLRRSFDDCFEMFDGGEVLSLLWLKAESNPTLKQRMVELGFRAKP